MKDNKEGRQSFPVVGGNERFVHPIWPARRVPSETVAAQKALARMLGFREGWTRRCV